MNEIRKAFYYPGKRPEQSSITWGFRLILILNLVKSVAYLSKESFSDLKIRFVIKKLAIWWRKHFTFGALAV